MTYRFGLTSESNLERVHPNIVRVLRQAIKRFDFTVLEGARSLERQRALFEADPPKTKTMNSKHLIQPDGYAHAVDIAPYPIDWHDGESFCALAGYVLGLADEMDVPLRWGGDWNRDWKLSSRDPSQRFNDYPHFELL